MQCYSAALLAFFIFWCFLHVFNVLLHIKHMVSSFSTCFCPFCACIAWDVCFPLCSVYCIEDLSHQHCGKVEIGCGIHYAKGSVQRCERFHYDRCWVEAYQLICYLLLFQFPEEIMSVCKQLQLLPCLATV